MEQTVTAHYAAIDWGMENFRLWLVSREGQIVAERFTEEGAGSIAPNGFGTVLEKHLENLSVSASLPVLICGAAGSRIGWREASCLSVPARLSEIADHTVRLDGYSRDVRFVAGIARDEPDMADIMRGEEAKLIGSHSGTDTLYLACLPGTHSKWVQVDEGRITRFSTFMTGEMFSVLRQHSTLKRAIEGADEVQPDSADFEHGVKSGYSNPEEFTSHLFSVYAAQLFHHIRPQQSLDRLSGLLIGCEIGGARVRFGQTENLRLIAGPPLVSAYEAALSILKLPSVSVDADSAVVNGLKSIADRIW